VVQTCIFAYRRYRTTVGMHLGMDDQIRPKHYFMYMCTRALSFSLPPIHFRLSSLPHAPPQVEVWKNDKSGDPACLMCRKTIRITRKITVQSLFAPATLDIFKKAASKQESALAAERARQAELAPSGTVGKELMAASVSTADLRACVHMPLNRHTHTHTHTHIYIYIYI
jgi:hypothetical protein